MVDKINIMTIEFVIIETINNNKFVYLLLTYSLLEVNYYFVRRLI